VEICSIHLGKYPLNHLDVTNCPNLKVLCCQGSFIFDHQGSLLTDLDLSKNINLVELDISNNNFYQDLSMFSHLVNLRKLHLNNNFFVGSLKPLKDLTKLKELDISDTNVGHGLEYLPLSVERFFCSFNERVRLRVSDI